MNSEIDEQLGYLRQHRPSDNNPIAVGLEAVAYSLALIARAVDEGNDITDHIHTCQEDYHR